MNEETKIPEPPKAIGRPLKIDHLYTPKEAGKQLRISSECYIRKMINRGQIKAVRIGGRWLINETELQYIIKNGTRPMKKADKKSEAKAQHEYYLQRKAQRSPTSINIH